MSGSMTSRMMRSGSSSSTAEMACAPFPTARTAKPAKRRLVVSRSRMFGSSSTISTRGPPLMRPVSARCLSVVWELDVVVAVRALCNTHAALSIARVEDDLVLGVASALGDTPEQVDVGVADDFGVRRREAVERAVGEDRSPVFGFARLVATGHQRSLQGAGVLTELPAALVCHSHQRLAHRFPSAIRLFNG